MKKSPLSVNEKSVTVDIDTLRERMIADVVEMEDDTLLALAKRMYPIAYQNNDDGTVLIALDCLKVDSYETLKDIF